MRRTILPTLAALFVLASVAPSDAEGIFNDRAAFSDYYPHPCTGEELYFAGWWHGTATLVMAKDGSGKYHYRHNEHAEVFDVEGGQRVGMYNKTYHEDLVGFYPYSDYSLLITSNQRMKLKGSPAFIVHTRTLFAWIDGQGNTEFEIVKLECRAD